MTSRAEHVPAGWSRDDAAGPAAQSGSTTDARLRSLRIPNPPRAGIRAMVAMAVVRSLASRLPVRIARADGTESGPSASGTPSLILRQPAMFYRRLGVAGRIGLGESYQLGEWDSDGLPALLATFATGIDGLVPPPVRRLGHLSRQSRATRPRSGLDRAKADVEYHYDLSNKLFELFLDETMTYSCALFEASTPGRLLAGEALLADAQRRKIDRLLDLARVGPGTTMLEVGTGWGELAIRAARRGAAVHTVTISAAQLSLARQRAETAGVADRITIHLLDYRQVDRTFCGPPGYDAIVSVEMIEAIGEGNWVNYFQALGRVLAAGGRVALQAITIRDDLAVARRTNNWLVKYIFPGGQLPSVQAINDIVSRHTGLRVLHHQTYGSHYEATLRLWRERFIRHTSAVRELGFDETFVRTWIFYLALCEAGFRSHYIDVGQFLLVRRA